MGASRTLWRIVLISLLTMPSTPARASSTPAPEVSLTDISIPSPFALGGPYACPPPDSRQDWEFEPSIAVNPRNRRQLVVAWVQDYYRGVVASFSRDGGDTWTTNAIPGLTRCTGGEMNAAVHARVAFSADGTAFVAAALQDGSCDLLTGEATGCILGRVAVTRSSDSGRTWDPPLYVATEQGINHLDDLVADPADPDAVYVAWAKRAFPDVTFVSRVDERDVATNVVRVARLGRVNLGNLQTVANGDLIYVVHEYALFGEEAGALLVTRSSDQGVSWSEEQRIGESTSLQFPELALAGDGSIATSWHDAADGGRNLYISTSSDDGASWTRLPSLFLQQSPTQPAPALAISDDGALNLIFTDARNDDPTDEGDEAEIITADVWLARSVDGGQSWEETHIGGPFDQRALDVHKGDGGAGIYAGAATIPCAVGATMVLGERYANAGISDIYFADIKFPSSTRCSP